MRFRKVHTKDEARGALLALPAPWAVDTETTGLNPHTDRLLSIVVGNKEEAVSLSPEWANLVEECCVSPLIFQNFKFDFHMLKRAGVDLSPRRVWDTMLVDHLLDENREHGLDAMVQREFGDNYKEVFWGKYKSFEEAPEEARLEYECKDVIYTARLQALQQAQLERQGIPESLVEHVHRLALSLWRTEYEGLSVDIDYLTKTGIDLQLKINALLPKMREAAGVGCELWELSKWNEEIAKRQTDKGKARVPRPEFSFDSPKQVSYLFYEALGLPKQFTEKRKVTVDDGALERLGDSHPVVSLLRDYRGHQKVYGAYIEGTLERQINGRIYPEFNVNGTKTGRISHSNPNMGQLPAQGGVRGIYVAGESARIISADYKQLEVVLAAHFSGDRSLLRIVLEGASQHDITAEGLGIPRPLAKTINFALQYGAGVHKIKKILGCSEQEAQHALDKYWETYSGLKKLIDSCHSKVDRGEPIITPFGRRRRFPSRFETKWERERAYRQSFNALIQGTGGDLTSRAFYLTDSEYRNRDMGLGLFTVHDEALVEVREMCVGQAREILIGHMQAVGQEIELTLPLSIDCSEGMLRWED